jgi:radical SAM superfamily enzyme YgiQ (UPF0313 family)
MSQGARFRILLIQAGTRPTRDGGGVDQVGMVSSAAFVPLPIATIAGLTPGDYEVELFHDAAALARGLDICQGTFENNYDIVGLSGMAIHLERAIDIARWLKSHNQFVVIGGPGVSGEPETCRGLFDVLFIGEAELIWQRFLRDWEAGRHEAQYVQIDKPDIALSPAPSWNNLSSTLKEYLWGTIQTTRGCPYDCEFCDVIYLFGRRQRHKPIPQVIQELRDQQRLGMERIFICDDEFVADRKYTKALLHEIIRVNNSFPSPVGFSTQLTVTLAKDEELQGLLADANFRRYLVGIESPNAASLRSVNKIQNIRQDLVADIRKILSNGVALIGSMVIGFDEDEEDIFDLHLKFYQDACIPNIYLHLLRADPGTPLWARLRQEERLLDLSPLRERGLVNLRNGSNVQPKKMTRTRMLEGFRYTMHELQSWSRWRDRIRGFVELAARERRVREVHPGPAEILRLADDLSLPREAKSAIEEVAVYAASERPYMMSIIQDCVLNFSMAVKEYGFVEKSIGEQLELERSGAVVLVPDKRPIGVALPLRGLFDRAFPNVYGRLLGNLSDRADAPVAATRVFVDFFVRWGHEVTDPDDRRLEFLTELADRTTAQLNGVPPEGFVGDGAPVMDVARMKRERIADSVWKAVGDELRRISGGGPIAESKDHLVQIGRRDASLSQ